MTKQLKESLSQSDHIATVLPSSPSEIHRKEIQTTLGTNGGSGLPLIDTSMTLLH